MHAVNTQVPETGRAKAETCRRNRDVDLKHDVLDEYHLDASRKRQQGGHG